MSNINTVILNCNTPFYEGPLARIAEDLKDIPKEWVITVNVHEIGYRQTGIDPLKLADNILPSITLMPTDSD